MAAAPLVSAAELEADVALKLEEVPELRFLKVEAEKLGVHAYLFGGTAASFAHYVKQDLLRRKGLLQAPAERFDYDFTSIFRSTQDLDVVIDGPKDAINQLSNVMRSRYPHFIGDKANKWELRSLRESTGEPSRPGYKEALLESADFLLQNTDSHSTGLIRVTAGNEPRVKDLRDWNSQLPQFEKDVLEGKLHFYHSDRHHETPRAAAGKNPELFSVVRALTKAFQYDLQFDRAALSKMKKIVAATDWESLKADYDNVRRLIDMGKKLFLHSVDVERSWNTLEQLGLREKLMAFDSPKVEGSMAWLMNKEPLRTLPLGTGDGPTAAEIARERRLEKLVVSHETNGFLAYESITRSRAGVPNFYVSRPDAVGEAAVLGWGVYSMLGRKGARGTQITVRMTIDPRARLGTDFMMNGDVFLIRNRAAVTTIHESIRLSTLGFLQEIARGKGFEGDLALLEAFRRRLSRNPEVLSATELQAIKDLMKAYRKDVRMISEVARLKIDLGYKPEEFIDLVSTLDITKAESVQAEAYLLEGLMHLVAKAKDSDRARFDELIRKKLGAPLIRWARVIQAYDAAGLSSMLSAGDREVARAGEFFAKRGAEAPANVARFIRHLFSAGQIIEVLEYAEMSRFTEFGKAILNEAPRALPVLSATATRHDLDYLKTLTLPREFWIEFFAKSKLTHVEQALVLNSAFHVKTRRGEKLPTFSTVEQAFFFEHLANKFIREKAGFEALDRLLIDTHRIREADAYGPRRQRKIVDGVLETELKVVKAALAQAKSAYEVADVASQIPARLKIEGDNDSELLREITKRFGELSAVDERTIGKVQSLYFTEVTLPLLEKAAEQASTARELLLVLTLDEWHLDRYEKNMRGGYVMLGQERDTVIFNALWKRFGKKFVSLNPTDADWKLIDRHKVYLPELEPGVGPFAKTKGPPKRALTCKSIFAS